MWNKYSACVNCETTERPHRGNGYCSLCRGPAMQMREVHAWIQATPLTLGRYPGDYWRDSPQNFEFLRVAYIQELQRRLDQVRHWERSIGTEVEGIQLEHQLSRIAHYAGVPAKDLFYGYANHFDWHFKPVQKQVLRDLFIKLELARPWRGVSLTRVFMGREKLREASAEG